MNFFFFFLIGTICSQFWWGKLWVNRQVELLNYRTVAILLDLSEVYSICLIFLSFFLILIMNTHPCNKNPYVYWIKKSKEKKGTERMKAKEQKFVLMSLRISKYFLKRKKVKIPVYGKLESNFSKLSSFKYL